MFLREVLMAKGNLAPFGAYRYVRNLSFAFNSATLLSHLMSFKYSLRMVSFNLSLAFGSPVY